jgi:hypothetical protein
MTMYKNEKRKKITQQKYHNSYLFNEFVCNVGFFGMSGPV